MRIKANVAIMLSSLAASGPKTERQLLSLVKPRGRSDRWGCTLFVRALPQWPAYPDKTIPRGWRQEYEAKIQRTSLVLRGLIERVGTLSPAIWKITQLGLDTLTAFEAEEAAQEDKSSWNGWD